MDFQVENRSAPSQPVLWPRKNQRSVPESITQEVLLTSGELLASKVEALLKQGNIRRISIQNREGCTLISIPIVMAMIWDQTHIENSPEINSVNVIATIVEQPRVVVEWQSFCPVSFVQSFPLSLER